MRVVYARNVNDALLKGLDMFNSETNYLVQESRNGTTYEIIDPVTTVFIKPWERVCLIHQRDANPFFHFIEGLWMLAGRKDLEPLTYFVKSMEDFSDDGKTLWGAYGWRWRNYFYKDQLDIIIEMLKNNPDDRRCVLQMWDGNKDLDRQSKDVPCNTCIYFKIREGKLNMTVSNRSNDMLWGAYGANVVHMSMLQEYMAAMLGVDIGVYRQVSDSFHIYLNPVWDKVKDLEIDIYTQREIKNPYDALLTFDLHAEYNTTNHVPLVTDPDSFDWELKRFFGIHPMDFEAVTDGWENAAFTKVAIPMMQCYAAYKIGEFDYAYEQGLKIKALDWRRACLDWIRKREKPIINNADEGGTHE